MTEAEHFEIAFLVLSCALCIFLAGAVVFTGAN